MTFKAMLAAAVEDVNDVRFPVYASPKLDGIRATIKGGVALSRSLKPIRNAFVQGWAKAHAEELEGLDGEFIIGDHDEGVFRRTTSGIMSADGTPDFRFHIFDSTADGGLRFKDRLADAYCASRKVERCCTVPHRLVENAEQLLELEQFYLDAGYEGLILRDPSGFYKNGRSTLKEGGMLKVKRFVDDEATIVGTVELQHNENEAKTNELGRTQRSSAQAGKVAAGTLGTLTAMTKAGVVFEIGTGFSASLRQDLWNRRASLVGKLVTYKHFPQGGYDAPRHAVFKGLRDPDDLS